MLIGLRISKHSLRLFLFLPVRHIFIPCALVLVAEQRSGLHHHLRGCKHLKGSLAVYVWVRLEEALHLPEWASLIGVGRRVEAHSLGPIPEHRRRKLVRRLRHA